MAPLQGSWQPKGLTEGFNPSASFGGTFPKGKAFALFETGNAQRSGKSPPLFGEIYK